MLCGGITPNHRTLGKFRVDNGVLLDRLLAESVAALVMEGVDRLGCAGAGRGSPPSLSRVSFRQLRTYPGRRQSCIKSGPGAAQIQHLSERHTAGLKLPSIPG
jgi:hypothetical protein